MSPHADLLELARRLADVEPPPGQASLRRAVSTSYYALYHLLVDAATRRMFGAEDDRAALRYCVARAFSHSTMKTVAQRFAGSAEGKKHIAETRSRIKGTASSARARPARQGLRQSSRNPP